jgi:tryptophanyl-tRNA synthetase
MVKEKFVVTPWEVRGEINYEKVMREFGIENIRLYLKKMKKLPPIYTRGIVFGHRDFGRIYEAIKNKKKFAVLTGFNPSGKLHLGNLLFLNQALFFQNLGGDVFIPISNDETYVFKKTKKIEEATKNALENVIPDIIALGFKEKKTKIFISTQQSKVYRLSVELSTKTTLSAIKAIFGFKDSTNPGQLYYTIVQAAHILFPQLKEFDGKKPVVVPIGLDQDPYVRLTRDMAVKAGYIKPSSTYHKFAPGLQGGKMSGSMPETCIFLDEDSKRARKKIMGAFSGGAKTLKEHREKGGNPDVDVAYQYLNFFFEKSNKKLKKIYDGYKKGEITTGELKEMAAEKLIKFLKDHQKKKKRAKNKVEKFILKD